MSRFILSVMIFAVTISCKSYASDPDVQVLGHTILVTKAPESLKELAREYRPVLAKMHEMKKPDLIKIISGLVDKYAQSKDQVAQVYLRFFRLTNILPQNFRRPPAQPIYFFSNFQIENGLPLATTLSKADVINCLHKGVKGVQLSPIQLQVIIHDLCQKVFFKRLECEITALTERLLIPHLSFLGEELQCFTIESLKETSKILSSVCLNLTNDNYFQPAFQTGKTKFSELVNSVQNPSLYSLEMEDDSLNSFFRFNPHVNNCLVLTTVTSLFSFLRTHYLCFANEDWLNVESKNRSPSPGSPDITISPWLLSASDEMMKIFVQHGIPFNQIQRIFDSIQKAVKEQFEPSIKLYETKLTKEIEDIKAQNGRLAKDLEKGKEERSKTDQKTAERLREERAKVKQKTAEIDALKTENVALAKTLKEQQQSLETTQKREAQLAIKLSQVQATAKQMTEARGVEQKRIEKLGKDRADTEEKNGRLQADLEQNQKDLQTLKAHQAKLFAELETVKNKSTTSENAYQGLQAQLLESRQNIESMQIRATQREADIQSLVQAKLSLEEASAAKDRQIAELLAKVAALEQTKTTGTDTQPSSDQTGSDNEVLFVPVQIIE